MMSNLVTIAGMVTLLGAAMIGGVFFAFSSFVMKALAAVPTPHGIAAMQSINVVVINRSFLGVFFGTAGLSLLMAGLAFSGAASSAAPLFLSGALFYLAGTFLVTVLANVPLNNQLAAVSASHAASGSTWEHYLVRWTKWNHVRTVSASLSTLAYAAGLLEYSAA